MNQTLQQACDTFKMHILPVVVEQFGADDKIAISEEWNNFTDALCKDGELTALQYRYCPAWGDDIPDEDDEREYLLERMGVRIGTTKIDQRPDRLMSDMPEGSTHWRVTVYRGESKSFQIHYSQGPAITTLPTICDVMHSLLADTDSNLDSFENWADDYGYDTDSRKAERIYHACQAILIDLKAMFTTQELEDLRTAFVDY